MGNFGLPDSERMAAICPRCAVKLRKKTIHYVTSTSEQWICEGCQGVYRVVVAPGERFGVREEYLDGNKIWRAVSQPSRPARETGPLVLDPFTGKPWKGRPD